MSSGGSDRSGRTSERSASISSHVGRGTSTFGGSSAFGGSASASGSDAGFYALDFAEQEGRAPGDARSPRSPATSSPGSASTFHTHSDGAYDSAYAPPASGASSPEEARRRRLLGAARSGDVDVVYALLAGGARCALSGCNSNEIWRRGTKQGCWPAAPVRLSRGRRRGPPPCSSWRRGPRRRRRPRRPSPVSCSPPAPSASCTKRCGTSCSRRGGRCRAPRSMCSRSVPPQPATKRRERYGL
jgi:hypothetical protein